jgi:hypothetical protein
MAITRRFRRLKMAELFGQKLKKGDLVTVIENIPKYGGNGLRILEGKVVYMHKRYIVIQLPKYRESFLTADIIAGLVKIKRRHAA